MRLGVLADVHGNLPALEAVLSDMEPYHVDGVIVAGDLVGGPQVNETLRLLRSLRPWMILGNSDINELRLDRGDAPTEWHASQQFALLRWGHAHLSQESRQLLRSLPEQVRLDLPGAAPMRVVHGSPCDPYEGISPDLEPAGLQRALVETSEAVLVCGHTHIPWNVERNGRLALNPGAVCGPLNGDVRAQYALLTWQGRRWHARHRAVAYDLARIRNGFIESGLLEQGGPLARAFLLSIETGTNVGMGWLEHAFRVAAEADCRDCQAVPDDIWERAALTFDWEGAGRRAWLQPAH